MRGQRRRGACQTSPARLIAPPVRIRSRHARPPSRPSARRRGRPRRSSSCAMARRRHRGAAVAARRARRPQQRRLGLSRRPRRRRRPRSRTRAAPASTMRRRARASASTKAASTTTSPRCASASRSRACCSPLRRRRAASSSTARRARGSRRGAARCIAASARSASSARAFGLRARGRPAGLPQPLDHAARARRSASTRASSSPPRRRCRPPCTTAPRLVEQLWLRPADALHESAALKLLTPTQKTLELLGRFASVDGAARMGGRRPRDRADGAARRHRQPGHAPGRCPTSRRGPSSAASIPRAAATTRTRSSPDVAVRLSPRVIARHREQRQRDDRAGHEHLSGRRRRRERMGGDRSGAARRGACAGDRRRGAGADPLDLRDPHAHRPFAGDACC